MNVGWPEVTDSLSSLTLCYHKYSKYYKLDKLIFFILGQNKYFIDLAYTLCI